MSTKTTPNPSPRKRPPFSRLACQPCLVALFVLFVINFFTLTASAAPPTQDDVLKSIHENVSSTTDISKVFPWLVAIAGLVVLLVLISQRRQRVASPRKLNHRGKLLKEVAKGIHLRKVEIKQLKMLADEKDLSSPLTLLICPSVLARAARTKNPRVDKKVLAQLAQRLAREEPKSA